MQFKRMVLVNQVEGAPMGQFTRLAPAQPLTIQETGIGTQLWKETGHVWTLDLYTVTVSL